MNSRKFFLVASSELLSDSSVAIAPGEIIVQRMFWSAVPFAALQSTRAQPPWWRSRPSTGGEHFDPENRSHVDDVAALLFLHVRQGSGNSI